jgi:putative phosphoribosyl transferase
MRVPFSTRTEAGRLLAARLESYKDRPDVIVLGLPRGGVPVAAEVAARLDAPLDILLVRKLGLPGQPELAFGAIASGSIRVLDEELISDAGITADVIEKITAREQLALEQREHLYRGERPPLDLSGRTVIVVDDGIATGATMHAALKDAQKRGARHVIIATPVMSTTAWERLAGEADDVICVAVPEYFYAVGVWYEEFEQVSDSEVERVLARCRSAQAV